jgi:hypothetical protein
MTAAFSLRLSSVFSPPSISVLAEIWLPLRRQSWARPPLRRVPTLRHDGTGARRILEGQVCPRKKGSGRLNSRAPKKTAPLGAEVRENA